MVAVEVPPTPFTLREAILDRLAESGYRVTQKVTQKNGGEVKVAQTVRRDLWSNVGRNDPCPCGSGKKFKQCCGK
jgi:uncharacterized protein YecA (UPF0149 family)